MIIPKMWSNPQNIFAYTLAARENLLNIIPPSSMTAGFTTFPSKLGNTHYISDTAILRDILIKRPMEFPKSRSIDVAIAPAIPQSIFVAEGGKWHEMHKSMIEVFNMRNIRARADSINTTIEEYLDGHPMGEIAGDITPYFQDLTFRVISQIIVGQDYHPAFDELRQHIEDYIEIGTRVNLYDIFNVKFAKLPNLRNLTMRKTINSVFSICEAIIDERASEPPHEEGDFLEHLMSAYHYRDAPNAKTREIIRDNLTTFLVAGHETTAITLAWASYVLGYFPALQPELAGERDAPLFDRPTTDAFIKEVMRLFPAAPFTERLTTQDETYGALHMRVNEGIIIPIVAIQRHREYWDNPDEFEPMRFIDFKPKPLSYLPFGAGPRVCIGQQLAMLEMRAIIPAILSRIAITPAADAPQPYVALTMRSRNGISVKMTPRA